MKIVLIEETNNQKPERSFEQMVIKVGRDPAECDLVFDPSEWPMVSRHHAEFREKDGYCLLVDTNSANGTFLNGRRIFLPVAVQGGERVQFGLGGPVVVLAHIELEPRPQAREALPLEREPHRFESIVDPAVLAGPKFRTLLSRWPRNSKK